MKYRQKTSPTKALTRHSTYRRTALLAAVIAASPALAQDEDLTALSLQDLLSIPISTASRFPQELRNTPAAAYVITTEDIRRSGATSVPELLRGVPGLHVAQVNSSVWAISARGFNGRFSNKLLVLIDGRAVYSPIFSGAFWHIQDVVLEDVERIEVIRGPGASIWGANAVNGVINIITKSSKDTHGALASAIAGTDERGVVSLRYGSRLSDTVDGRIYAKYLKRAERSLLSNGNGGNDDWDAGRVGFRVDWQPSGNDQVALQGEVVTSDAGETAVVASLTPPYSVTSRHGTTTTAEFIRASWDRQLENGDSIALQAYFDHSTRDYWQIKTDIDTFDIEFQHQIHLGSAGRLSWGLDYRVNSDDLEASETVVFSPSTRRYERIGAFAEYELDLTAHDLKLLAGSKIEQNTFTGWDIQPTARFIWSPSPGSTVWGAISRAVRVPSRAETDISLRLGVIPPLTARNPTPLPAEVRGFGNPNPVSEKVIAYELGYRAEVTSTLALDVATYYNSYSELSELLAAGPPALQPTPPPHLLVPILNTMAMKAETYGFEVSGDWFLSDQYRVRGAYSFYAADFHRAAPTLTGSTSSDDGTYPRQQISIGLISSPLPNVDVDVTLRGVGRVDATNISSYVTADVRLGWKAAPGLDLSVVGRNLLDASHPEFVSEYLGTQATEMPRSVFLQVVWRHP